MSQESSLNSPQLRTLFPDYWRIDSLVRAEVQELSEVVLDWTSDRWSWSEWSIRQQTSHMASVPLRWIIGMWGDQLFRNDHPVTAERYADLTSTEFDRRLNDCLFWNMDDILGGMDEELDVCRKVLTETSVERARSITVERKVHEQWELMRTVHPDGVSLNPETAEWSGMDLVATFRHVQNEFYTHLFNIQRAKIALGIEPIVKLPNAGYHKAVGWDSDLPSFGAAVSDIE